MIIVYQNPDDLTGSLLTYSPSPESLKSKSIDEVVIQIIPTENSLGNTVSVHHEKGAVADFSLDWEFLDAWRYDSDSTSFIVDMDSARDQHRESMKKIRKKKWQSMGVIENMNPSLDSLFDTATQTVLSDLRTLENLDLSTYTDVASLKSFLPTFLQ